MSYFLIRPHDIVTYQYETSSFIKFARPFTSARPERAIIVHNTHWWIYQLHDVMMTSTTVLRSNFYYVAFLPQYTAN